MGVCNLPLHSDRRYRLHVRRKVGEFMNHQPFWDMADQRIHNVDTTSNHAVNPLHKSIEWFNGFVLLGFIGITLFALSGLIHLVRMAVEAIL